MGMRPGRYTPLEFGDRGERGWKVDAHFIKAWGPGVGTSRNMRLGEGQTGKQVLNEPGGET